MHDDPHKRKRHSQQLHRAGARLCDQLFQLLRGCRHPTETSLLRSSHSPRLVRLRQSRGLQRRHRVRHRRGRRRRPRRDGQDAIFVQRKQLLHQRQPQVPVPHATQQMGARTFDRPETIQIRQRDRRLRLAPEGRLFILDIRKDHEYTPSAYLAAEVSDKFIGKYAVIGRPSQQHRAVGDGRLPQNGLSPQNGRGGDRIFQRRERVP